MNLRTKPGRRVLPALSALVVLLASGWAGDAARQTSENLEELYRGVSHAVVSPTRPCLSETCGRGPNPRCAHCAELHAGYADFRALSEILFTDPEAWLFFGPRLERVLLDEEASAELQEGLLNVAVYAPSDTTLEWLERLHAIRPRAFADGHVIGLSEAGSPYFVEIVHVRSDAGSVRAAAYLGYKHDDRGLDLLLKTVEHGSSPRETVLAAQALAQLGKRQAWREARRNIRATVDAHLAAGQFAVAREKTIEVEYLYPLFGGTGRPGRYTSGGWWGFDRKAPFWPFKAGAADLPGTELAFFLTTKEAWHPDRAELHGRIAELSGD